MRGQIIGSIAIAASLLGACGKTRLMEAMVGTNETNKKILGQMFAVGGGGKAAIGSDGIARIAVEHHAEEPLPEGTEIKPGPSGGKEGFLHAAYSPRIGYLYVPVIENTATFKTGPAEFKEGMPWWGDDVETLDHPQGGSLKAIDQVTGEEAWSWEGKYPMAGSILATVGELVFTGEPDGHFNAWDARTGELLWRFQTGSGIHSSPITYHVDGKQDVAVLSGWGGWVPGIAPNMLGAPRGATLYVFALPDRLQTARAAEAGSERR